MNLLYWIGIDPGVKIGYALWSVPDKRIVSLHTFHEFNLFRNHLQVFNSAWEGQIKVALEDTTLKNHIWDGKGRPSPDEVRKLLKVARNVGMNQGACREIKHLLEWLKISYLAIRPGDSPTKVEEGFFKKLTGWTGKVTEHSMDAAMLVVGR